jgi:hypothetical protein
VDADAFGFVERAGGLALVAPVALQLVAAKDARRIAELLVHHTRLGAQRVHLLGAVRDEQVAAVMGIAIDRLGQALEALESAADLGIEPARDIQAPALDPLRALQPAACVLSLAAAAARAAPRQLIRFEHRRLHAVRFGQAQRSRQAGRAGADDDDIGVDVVRDRAVVGWRRAGGRDPVGGRVGAAGARVVGDQRVVARVVALVGRRVMRAEAGARRRHHRSIVFVARIRLNARWAAGSAASCGMRSWCGCGRPRR